jgi:predicted ribosomally synthesized peptide with nif11-like leader
MSRENVVLFSKAITTNPDLNKRIASVEASIEEWLGVARDAGFEFTPQEFASVVGETLGRTVSPADAVREYLGAQHEVGEAELSDAALDAIAGGARARGWMLP